MTKTEKYKYQSLQCLKVSVNSALSRGSEQEIECLVRVVH